MARARILVVDDFEPWRRIVCSMLEGQAELQVVGEATDGLEAIQKTQTLKPDLILLDLVLPSLNGLEAADRIRQVDPGARIIILTLEKDKDVVNTALSTEAQGYVLKADAGCQLLPPIKAILRGESFVSSGIEGGRR